jgi:uncharacterized membrane protein
MREYIIAFFVLALIDVPWLTLQMSTVTTMFTKIQGSRALAMRLWAAPIVYAALAYLLVQMKSLKQAAASGVAVYAVYDFTNLLTFKDYNLSFAIQDTLWGGVLFSIAYSILEAVR